MAALLMAMLTRLGRGASNLPLPLSQEFQLSKPYWYRDGPVVDGAPSRQPYTMAEMSDLPAPLVNLANPGTPTPVLSGPATETLTALRRFRSTPFKLIYTWRTRVSITTANGWVIYTVPSIAGYQFPHLTCKGVYMQSGDNEASGVQNAAMRMNGVVWADIGRIYYSQSSGKDTAETWWMNIEAEYYAI